MAFSTCRMIPDELQKDCNASVPGNLLRNEQPSYTLVKIVIILLMKC